MDGQLGDPERLDALRRIARAAVRRRMTSSALLEVESITNEALTQLLEYAQHHRIESPEALVSVIASRAAIKARDDWERRRAYVPLPEDQTASDGEEGHLDGGEDSRIIAVLKGHSQTLWLESMRAMAAIAELNSSDRKIAEMIFLEELKAAEAAEALGRNVRTVKNRLVEIRRTLRLSLDGGADAESS